MGLKDLKEMQTTVVEDGIHFKTGKPVKFPYIRNTQKAPFLGSRFQQDIEPAGRFVTFDSSPNESPLPLWEKGELELKKPLVLKFNKANKIDYDENSWKAFLADKLNVVGRELSRKLRKEGYDGIVTVNGGETSEIVVL